MKFPILLPNIFNHPFTYESDIKLDVGDYVEVPFGKSKMTGIVWNEFDARDMAISRASFENIPKK